MAERGAVGVRRRARRRPGSRRELRRRSTRAPGRARRGRPGSPRSSAASPLSEYGEAALRRNLNDLAVARACRARARGRARAALAAGRVVPLRICTIFADEDGLRAMLAERGADLRGARALDGREEWGVKCRRPRRARAAARADARRSPRSPRPGQRRRLLSAGAGRARGARGGRRARAAALAEDVHARLQAPSRRRRRAAARRTATCPGHEGEMVLNAAYLVDARQSAGFASSAAELEERERELGAGSSSAARCPPYNFVRRRGMSPSRVVAAGRRARRPRRPAARQGRRDRGRHHARGRRHRPRLRRAARADPRWRPRGGVRGGRAYAAMIELLAITDGPAPPAPPLRAGAAGEPASCARRRRGPAPTPDALWRHEELLEPLMEDRDLLPVRFGTRRRGRARPPRRGSRRARDELAGGARARPRAVEIAVRARARDGRGERCPRRAAAASTWPRSWAAAGRRELHEPLAALARESVVQPRRRAAARRLPRRPRRRRRVRAARPRAPARAPGAGARLHRAVAAVLVHGGRAGMRDKVLAALLDVDLDLFAHDERGLADALTRRIDADPEPSSAASRSSCSR